MGKKGVEGAKIHIQLIIKRKRIKENLLKYGIKTLDFSNMRLDLLGTI